MAATMTQTFPVMANEVPVVSGDIFRSIHTPTIPPPSVSPSLSVQLNGPPTNAPHRRRSSAASDAAKAAGIDLEAISMAEARKIMSEEHKILGFRPPHGSFAAEVQSVAAKCPEGKPGVPVDTNKLKEMAREDALRILSERKNSVSSGSDGSQRGSPPSSTKSLVAPSRLSPSHAGINLNTINATDARILMSHEHRALGFRPPPGSLAAEAQSAATRHPDGDGTHLDDGVLRDIAIRDAERIKADRELNIVGEVNVSTVGKDGAAAIMSAEARALGHRPPTGSLAAQAQSAADKHPAGGSFAPSTHPVELAVLKDAATREGERLRAQEQEAKEGEPAETVDVASPKIMKEDAPVEIEKTAEASPPVPTPLVRNETEDSVEIICDVLE